MPTLSIPRAGRRGEGMATQNVTAPSGPLVPVWLRNIRMSNGTIETVVSQPIFIHKIMITHDDTGDNFFAIQDMNGYVFKMFLHQTDLRQAPGILNRRPPPTFLVEALDTAFTSKTEIIDIPAPGLRAEGNIGIEAGVNNTTDTTIYYTYASDTADPTPSP